MIPTLEWTPEGVRFLDQTRLPLEETYVLATSYQQVADVITTMVVRGAPAIGVSAAMGVALGVKTSHAATAPALAAEFETMCRTLAATRPTAVNLFWAIDRMKSRFSSEASRSRSYPQHHPRRPYRRSPPYVRRRHRRLPPHGRPRRSAAAHVPAASSPTATPVRSPPAATAPPSASSVPPSSRATRSTFTPTKPAPSSRARASPPGS